jgi:hypothetical protein
MSRFCRVSWAVACLTLALVTPASRCGSSRATRAAGLDRVLRHIRGKGGVWGARRDEIAQHWLRVHGRASAAPA